MKTLSISSLLIRVIAVILAMGVHEAAHGLVSYCFGDPTALNRGRLTLNPLAHIDWLGLLCLLVFGFGWARPVPVDSSYYNNRKTGMIWTSFAGPMANFLLSFLCVLLYYVCFRFHIVAPFLLNCLSSTAFLSMGFGIFNLIPIPPLDGSKILFSFLPDDQYLRFTAGSQITMFIFLLLIVSGVLNAPLSLMINNAIQLFSNVSQCIVGL